RQYGAPLTLTFCEACGTGIYCRAVCTKSVYSYQPDLFEDCGGAST
ncbi:TPA: hypothetical protein ACGGIW_004613, partial [Escherichia coli]